MRNNCAFAINVYIFICWQNNKKWKKNYELWILITSKLILITMIMGLLRLQTLGRQNCRKFSISSTLFVEKEIFVRGSSLNINLASIGDAGHGKTLLSSNITKVGTWKVNRPCRKFIKNGKSWKIHQNLTIDPNA